MYIESIPSNFLEFDYAPDHISTTKLQIRNIHSTRISFKIRTTAPSIYIVYPSSGSLSVGESQELIVKIISKVELQDFQKHKFLIQTAPCSEYLTPQQVSTFWSFQPGDVKDLKLSVKLKEAQPITSTFMGLSSEYDENSKIEKINPKEFHEKEEKLEEEHKAIFTNLKTHDDHTNKINVGLIKTVPINYLEFDFTPGQSSSKNLQIQNIHSTGICFKTKTTAPRIYKCTPSSGFLSVGESQDVVVTMNSQGELKDYQKQKFLIQAAPSPVHLSREQLNNFWGSKPVGVKNMILSVMISDLQLKTSSVVGSVSGQILSD